MFLQAIPYLMFTASLAMAHQSFKNPKKDIDFNTFTVENTNKQQELR